MRTYVLLFLLLSVACGAYAAEGPSAGRRVDLALRDATLTEAAASLGQVLGVQVSVKAPVPAERASVVLKAAGTETALNAVARLYRAAWEREGKGITFSVPPLDRRVDLELHDADLPTALKALQQASGLKFMSLHAAPSPRVTITLRAVTVRDAVDTLTTLYGLRWQKGTQIVVFSPDALAKPDGAVAAFVGILGSLIEQAPGEEEARWHQVATKLIDSFPAASVNAIRPGQPVAFAVLTDEQQALALETAQRSAIRLVLQALAKGPLLNHKAALTGEGLQVEKSADGKWLQFTMPYRDGARAVLVGTQTQ